MNVVLFGIGHWGKILANNLKDNYNLLKIFDSKSRIENYDFTDVNWAVVATDNVNHFGVVKFLLNKKVNVFCEKPLTINYTTSKEIVSIANEKNLKLYINHIYNKKRSKIKIVNNNFIYRSKNSKKTFENILFDLFYHDLYLIINYINLNDIEISNLSYNEVSLIFKIYSNNKTFNFSYYLDRNTEHIINDVSLIDDINYLPEEFKNVFNYKVNFEKNNLIALNCNKFIDKLINFKKNFNA